jgi:recombination protein RecT
MADNYSIIKRYAKSDEIQQVFADIVGAENANRYILSVITAVSASPELQKCTPQSIMRSAARAATLGLSCDPSVAQAYLVPYKGEASFQTGWRGIRDMAYASGNVAHINVDALYEGQTWVQDQMTGKAHIEGMMKSHKPIGYFAYIKFLNGRENFLYMTMEEIDAHKQKYSQGWNSKFSAWTTAFDKMAKKTVLKQLLSQWATLTPLLMQVDSIEGSVDSLEEMPEPELVTVSNPLEGMTNDQIMSDLGFEPDIVDATFSEEPEPEPEQKAKPKPQPRRKPAPKKEQTDKTNYPGSQSELYSWIAQGHVPYVGIKDAQKAIQESKGDIEKAWELILSWSKEWTEEVNQQDQPPLI